MVSPFKKPSSPSVPLKHISGDVPEAEYLALFSRASHTKGFQDFLIATLFQRLTLAFHNANIPLPTDATSSRIEIRQQLYELVCRTPLPPIDGARLYEDVS